MAKEKENEKSLPESASKKTASNQEKKSSPKKKPVKTSARKEGAEKDEKKSASEKPKEEKKQKPTPKKKTSAKKVEEKKDEEEKEEQEEEVEIIEEEEGGYTVKIKPKMKDDIKHGLRTRRTIKRKTPHFRQQEWFRYKRINESWRKPRGIHSKMRKHKGYRQNVVSIGYGSPSRVRNLHPSGFQEIMVYNKKDLLKIDPKLQAARVGHSVGTRKRIEIEAEAQKKGIRVLNPRR